MLVEKHIERQIKRNAFLLSGKINVDSNYFINAINEGVKTEHNLNFKTNIKDKMTSWNYFNHDPKFLELLTRFIDLVDDNFDQGTYRLQESWGFSMGFGGLTKFHNHAPSLWSGALYLNDHNQTLDFPDLKEKIKPSEGRFVLFSSFLEHGCERHREEKVKYGVSFNMFSYSKS
tara:strand:- start:96 stop:617 length:522 start_codon:yes stop_codon:yes gene_type:complete